MEDWGSMGRIELTTSLLLGALITLGGLFGLLIILGFLSQEYIILDYGQGNAGTILANTDIKPAKILPNLADELPSSTPQPFTQSPIAAPNNWDVAFESASDRRDRIRIHASTRSANLESQTSSPVLVTSQPNYISNDNNNEAQISNQSGGAFKDTNSTEGFNQPDLALVLNPEPGESLASFPEYQRYDTSRSQWTFDEPGRHPTLLPEITSSTILNKWAQAVQSFFVGGPIQRVRGTGSIVWLRVPKNANVSMASFEVGTQ